MTEEEAPEPILRAPAHLTRCEISVKHDVRIDKVELSLVLWHKCRKRAFQLYDMVGPSGVSQRVRVCNFHSRLLNARELEKSKKRTS